MLKWLFGNRRKRLWKEGLAVSERRWLAEHFWPWASLDVAQRDQLQRWIHVFIQQKHWEGCKGLTLDRSMQMMIAAQAGLLTMGWRTSDYFFDGFATLLVYPDAYVADAKVRLAGEVAVQTTQARRGETSYRGPVIVNLNDATRGFHSRNDGENVVLHEFAHQLDFADGAFTEGLPPLPKEISVERWKRVFAEARQRLESYEHHGYRGALDPYGLSSPNELFPVSVESFFQEGPWLAETEPELYDLLREFFRTDPARWG
jgi:MtfA peptidase